ncbi:ATP-binding cassette domain-containing protein, partial [Campylobacter jejuni]|uniref:ATP-binding cassette domain-containing protein n=1 Tax=Campylobacter jejuni TaxID=197 RepID=UPI001F09B326
MSDAKLLETRKLVVDFNRRRVIDALDIAVPAGTVYALLGRNGAGKTTLLRLIAGRLEADRGARRVKPGTRIVFLEQDPDFAPYATLMD